MLFRGCVASYRFLASCGLFVGCIVWVASFEELRRRRVYMGLPCESSSKGCDGVLISHTARFSPCFRPGRPCSARRYVGFLFLL